MCIHRGRNTKVAVVREAGESCINISRIEYMLWNSRWNQFWITLRFEARGVRLRAHTKRRNVDLFVRARAPRSETWKIKNLERDAAHERDAIFFIYRLFFVTQYARVYSDLKISLRHFHVRFWDVLTRWKLGVIRSIVEKVAGEHCDINQFALRVSRA